MDRALVCVKVTAEATAFIHSSIYQLNARILTLTCCVSTLYLTFNNRKVHDIRTATDRFNKTHSYCSNQRYIIYSHIKMIQNLLS